jgi:hypothetical protein
LSHKIDVLKHICLQTADDFPVLAFTGAPAPFPVQAENIPVQKYLVWNQEMNSR